MDRRLAAALALLIVAFAGGSVAQSGSADVGMDGLKGVPLRDVPAALRSVWMRFHEADLCLGVDTVFVFQAKGLEMWCRVKDERDYQQLTALVEPLRKSYRIDLYTTRSDREKKPYAPEDDDPPPSFWTNAELRAYMRDPFFSRLGSIDDASGDLLQEAQDPELKRRLKIFGDQILEWVSKMERLTGDLPSLAAAGYGADLMPDIRNRARAVCLDHAREAGKCAGRLAENLSHALPRGTGRPPDAKPPRTERANAATPYEDALLLSGQAQDLAQRIMHFIYPQAHTVTLIDLREPGLIDSLKALQQAVSDFESDAKRVR